MGEEHCLIFAMTETLQVGVAGLGAVGRPVARALAKGVDNLRLAAVSSRDLDRARTRMAEIAPNVSSVPAASLPEQCDVIVECVPKAAFAEVAGVAIDAGKILVTVSGAALLVHPDIIERAKVSGARIVLATGALLGLDAVRAAAEGQIEEVRMITRKPPMSLRGAPHLKRNGISIERLAEPLKVFEGTAREGAAGFPANVNVAAALGLAGIGPDRTRLEIWADPELDRNTHEIIVTADSARLSMKIENVPSEENPGTGKITALSVIAALRALGTPLKVGT